MTYEGNVLLGHTYVLDLLFPGSSSLKLLSNNFCVMYISKCRPFCFFIRFHLSPVQWFPHVETLYFVRIQIKSGFAKTLYQRFALHGLSVLHANERSIVLSNGDIISSNTKTMGFEENCSLASASRFWKQYEINERVSTCIFNNSLNISLFPVITYGYSRIVYVVTTICWEIGYLKKMELQLRPIRTFRIVFRMWIENLSLSVLVND
jgi:hypothetical protein